MANPTGSGKQPLPAFQTYAAYLDDIREDWPEYLGLRNYLEITQQRYDQFPYQSSIGFIDFNSSGDCSLHPEQLHYSQRTFESEAVRGEQVAKFRDVLQQWPPDVHERIVVVSCNMFDHFTVDTLGLLYDVEPYFFWEAVRSSAFWQDWKLDCYDQAPFLTQALPSLRCRACQSDNHEPHEFERTSPLVHRGGLEFGPYYLLPPRDIVVDSSPRSVAILFTQANEYGNETMMSPDPMMLLHAMAYKEKPSVHSPKKPTKMRTPFYADNQPCESIFIELSFNNLVQSLLRSASETSGALPLRHLFISLRTICELEVKRPLLDSSTISSAAIYFADASQGKANLDGFKDINAKYLSVRGDLDLFQIYYAEAQQFMRKFWKDEEEVSKFFEHISEIKQRSDKICEHWDAYYRLFVDLRTSERSVEMSERSIEMARVSIEESKRVKNLTVLAFIFVPMSLASSIFGMNVQEINSTGKNIWTFAVTAVALLAVSPLLWLLANMAANAHSNWKDPRLYRMQSSYGHRLLWFSKCFYSLHSAATVLSPGFLLGLFTGGRYGFYATDYLDTSAGDPLRCAYYSSHGSIAPSWGRPSLRLRIFVRDVMFLLGMRTLPKEFDAFRDTHPWTAWAQSKRD